MRPVNKNVFERAILWSGTTDLIDLISFANASERFSQANPATGELTYAGPGIPLIITVNGVRYMSSYRAVTNLQLNSMNMSLWGYSGLPAPILSTTENAPYSALKAAIFEDADAAGYRNSTQQVSCASNTEKHTWSFFSKYYNWQFLFHDIGFVGGSSKRSYYDLINGTSGIGTVESVYGLLYPNGWMRCQATVTNTNKVAATHYIYPAGAASLSSISPTIVGKNYFFGGQLEVGNYATRLVRTIGSAATCAKDEALIASALVSQQLRDRWQWSGYLGMASTQLVAGDRRTLLDFADSGGNICTVWVSGDDLKVHVTNSNGADAILSAALTWTPTTKWTVTGIRATGSLTVAGPTGGSTVTGSAWNRPDGALYLNMDSSLANQLDGMGRIDPV